MLEKIEMPGAPRRTTRIGFGGSGLMGALSKRESLRLLETAFDAGVRHYDVAPSYGHGMAERCLGEFLRGKADQVTVATKYGILPPPQAGLLEMARNATRPLARRVPSVRRRLGKSAASLKAKSSFSAEEARRSLERSLQEMGLERLDVWLLHEATADDLDQSDLLPFLEKMQREGRLGAFGIGGDPSHLEVLWRRHRGYCRVLQFERSALDSIPNLSGAFQIHYRAILGASAKLDELFTRDPQLCDRWSSDLDADLADPEVLAALLLNTALVSNPDGLVLFSSRQPAHIRANLRMADDPASAARSRRFMELIRSRGPDPNISGV